MKKLNYFIIVLVSFNFTLKVNAQPSWFHQPDASGPYTENQDDPKYNNWSKPAGLSDNFDRTKLEQLDPNKWFVFDYLGCYYNGAPAVTGDPGFCINAEDNILFNYDSQVPDQADVLILAVDPPNAGEACYKNIQGTNEFGIESNYFSAAIESQPTQNYNYGYYEANIKLPGWSDINSPSGYCADGFHPAFWLVGGSGLFTEIGGSCLQTEIDIMEPGGNQLAYADTVTGSFHSYKPTCWSNCSDPTCGDNGFCNLPVDLNVPANTRQNYQVATFRTASATPLNLGYHNYAVEFLPDRIIFYFDRQPYAWVLAECQSVDASQIRNAFNIIDPTTGHPFTMHVQFGNSVDGPPGTYTWPAPNPDALRNTMNTPDPPIVVGPDAPRGGRLQDKTQWTNQSEWNMYVNKFNYWTLNCDDNQVNAMIYNTTDLDVTTGQFTYSVKKSITFDGNSSTISVPTSSPFNNLTFRATDEIDIKPGVAGFVAPAGNILNLIITPCNQ